MKDIYPSQDGSAPQRSLMDRLAQSRLVQVTALGGLLTMLGACANDANGVGDAALGVEVQSDVLVIANADGFPNTTIQCVTDTVILSNTRTNGDPQKVIDHQPDLCAAVALTLKNHKHAGDDAVIVDHLDCPTEPINPDLARGIGLEPSFGLCG